MPVEMVEQTCPLYALGLQVDPGLNTVRKLNPMEFEAFGFRASTPNRVVTSPSEPVHVVAQGENREEDVVDRHRLKIHVSDCLNS